MTALSPAAAADPRALSADAAASPSGWTCPFCSLLCEPGSEPSGSPPRVVGLSCPRAQAAMAALEPGGGSVVLIDGQPARLAEALDAAASRLSGWQQALFGGLATDIAGARALYRLAARIGAICDHADGDALMLGLRALQDRGQYTATLGEVRSRAELIVFIGTPGTARHPELFRRFGLGEPGSPCQEVVFLGLPVPADLAPGVSARTLPGSGRIDADLQQLSALIDRRRLPDADPGLAALAERLLASPYAVLVWEPASLPAEGSLAIELIGRCITTLNRSTRAASFGLGGNDGGFSVNQTLTWLSGLPLRTRVAADGLQHEPHHYSSKRLLAGQAVDGLLWISSFGPDRLPPVSALPRIVLGTPQMAGVLGDMASTVFIAVATPGWNAGGHLFRIDGPVVVPVFAARDDGLPSVAEVLGGLSQRIEGRS